MTKAVRNPTQPLRTRHLFLDTEVYRRAGFNISNTPFALLAKQIEEGCVALHVTDITLAEIHRLEIAIAPSSAKNSKPGYRALHPIKHSVRRWQIGLNVVLLKPRIQDSRWLPLSLSMINSTRL